MRRSGWETGFLALIQHETQKPFSWQENNCLDLVVKNVEHLRGKAECPVPCSWKSKKEARQTLAKLGFKSLSDGLAHYFKEIDPVVAQRGDIGTIDNGALICVGGLFVGRGEEGQVFKQLNQIERAFRV